MIPVPQGVFGVCEGCGAGKSCVHLPRKPAQGPVLTLGRTITGEALHPWAAGLFLMRLLNQRGRNPEALDEEEVRRAA